MYNFDGKVKNCIRSIETMPIGNICDTPIEDIVQGIENVNRQNKIVNKIPVPSCQTCYDIEHGKQNFDIVSDRVFYIRELKHTSLATYTPGNFELKTIDVRWSNLCNFACVYCGPMFSSKWTSELNLKSNLPTDDQVENFKRYIFDHATTLKHVYLAGGEPLLMKQNLELLELLLKVNPDVNLRINTNLSNVDTKVFDTVCKFKNVHWTISVETTGDEFEYIRYGGSWQDFVKNLTTVRQLDHKITFNMLHFLLNYTSIFGCVDWLQSEGFHPNSFVIGAMLMPDYLNIRHLPETTLQQVKQELQHRINQNQGYLLDDSYRNMLYYINTPAIKNLQGSFEKLAELDKRRNLDSKKIFTNLYKDHYYGKTI
jgi:sulfatase maturation enzyme AslB (radical SAM superfamily)